MHYINRSILCFDVFIILITVVLHFNFVLIQCFICHTRNESVLHSGIHQLMDKYGVFHAYSMEYTVHAIHTKYY